MLSLLPLQAQTGAAVSKNCEPKPTLKELSTGKMRLHARFFQNGCILFKQFNHPSVVNF